jgi:hypothetical protein
MNSLPQSLRTSRALLLLTAALLVPGKSPALTWRWSNPTPHGNDIVDMAWTGYLSVQVAELGQLYTGTDFLGWVPQNSGTTNDLQAVKFFGQRIVFVGANGTVGYSDDGVKFTASALITPDTPADWLVDMGVSSNLVVSVGDNGVIYTSSDGVAWHYQGRAPNNPNGDWLLSAAWGGGTFVITGENGYLATSPNGTNWTTQSSGVSDDLMRVTWISATNPVSLFPYTGFWAVTYDGKAIYSTNSGASWKSFSLGVSTNILYAAAANSTSGLLAGDTDVRLGTSAANWQRQTSSLQNPSSAPSWTYYCALWDNTNGVYRLGGDDGMMVAGTPSTNNTYDWEMQYPDNDRSLLWQATVVNGLYVAVGDYATIMTSDNGGDWTTEALPLTNSISLANTVFFCVGGNSNLLIAAGNSGSLAVSPNTSVNVVLTNVDGTLSTNAASSLGVVWYSLPAPATNDLTGICAFSNKFYLAGSSATLLSSANGTNWTRVAVPAAGSIDLAGLASSSNTLVAVGDQGLILSSSDGTTWVKQTSGTANGLFRVRYLNGCFLALGENGTILKSTTGLSWSPMISGTTNWVNDAVMVSNVCYVVGNQGTVLASSNFLNWTNIGCITYQSLYGAAEQNGQLVVVGLQGTILRSQIIPNLTSPIFFYYYAQASGQNIFYVSGAPDQQFTLDYSTNLKTWTTGPLLDFIYGSGTLTFLTSLGANPPPAQFYRATLVP